MSTLYTEEGYAGYAAMPAAPLVAAVMAAHEPRNALQSQEGQYAFGQVDRHFHCMSLPLA